LITQEELKDLLHYDKNTGLFIWINTSKYNCYLNGSVAGSIDREGYVRIGLLGERYPAHSLAWLYIYGIYPLMQIDHINHVRSCNKISNLRQATSQQNSRNRSISSVNVSGTVGVSWHKRIKKWYATIWCNGKQKSIGYFFKKEDAIKARKNAEKEIGYHNNHGT